MTGGGGAWKEWRGQYGRSGKVALPLPPLHLPVEKLSFSLSWESLNFSTRSRPHSLHGSLERNQRTFLLSGLKGAMWHGDIEALVDRLFSGCICQGTNGDRVFLLLGKAAEPFRGSAPCPDSHRCEGRSQNSHPEQAAC